MIIVKTVGSLDKVFACGSPKLEETHNKMLRNERFSFQVCFYNDEGRCYSAGDLKIESDIEPYCTLRIVEHISGQFTKTPDSDDYVLKKDEESSGLYPELLRPIREDGLCLRGRQWTSVWVTVYNKDGLPAGTHSVKIKLSFPDYAEEICAVYTLETIDAFLPDSDLFYTDWMHYDGIAHYYGEKPFTPRYYERLAPFVDSAVEHGMNMLFTPLFTPPLDTAVGMERMETQLVEVTYRDGKYTFSFEELGRFIRFALGRGIKYIEFSHLATQWGSEYCPKIMAHTENGYERIFGWDTPSTGEGYKMFLTEFLPSLCAFIEGNGWKDICYFHVSDEPPEERRQTFTKISGFIRSLLKGYRILDATADPNSKQLDIPVISVSRYTEDMDKRCWVYYSNGAYKNYVPNRYFNMPSLRNRILGIQLYLNDIQGFLHWGFNFYKTTLSRRYVDPYSETDGNGGFQSGDAFIVYPTENGVLDSLRHEVFYDGLQDRMLLCLLEKKIGKENVKKVLKDAGMSGFGVYPHSERWFADLREKLLSLVEKEYKE